MRKRLRRKLPSAHCAARRWPMRLRSLKSLKPGKPNAHAGRGLSAEFRCTPPGTLPPPLPSFLRLSPLNPPHGCCRHHGFLLFSPKAQRRVISELLLMAAASPPTAQLEPQPVYGTHPVYDKEPSCAVIVPQKKRGLCSKQCSRETDETGSLDSSSGDESARAASEVLPRL